MSLLWRGLLSIDDSEKKKTKIQWVQTTTKESTNFLIIIQYRDPE